MTTTQDWADSVRARALALWPTCKVYARPRSEHGFAEVRIAIGSDTRRARSYRAPKWTGYYGHDDSDNGQTTVEADDPIDAIVKAATDERAEAIETATACGAWLPPEPTAVTFDATEYARAVREAFISGIITGADAGQVTANRAWLASSTRRDLLAALTSRGCGDADAVKIADNTDGSTP